MIVHLGGTQGVAYEHGSLRGDEEESIVDIYSGSRDLQCCVVVYHPMLLGDDYQIPHRIASLLSFPLLPFSPPPPPSQTLNPKP